MLMDLGDPMTREAPLGADDLCEMWVESASSSDKWHNDSYSFSLSLLPAYRSANCPSLSHCIQVYAMNHFLFPSHINANNLTGTAFALFFFTVY